MSTRIVWIARIRAESIVYRKSIGKLLRNVHTAPCRKRGYGAHIFNSIDFGGHLRITSNIQAHLTCVDQHENSQLALIYWRASMECAIQEGRKEYQLVHVWPI